MRGGAGSGERGRQFDGHAGVQVGASSGRVFADLGRPFVDDA
jgi:hypothetical protein